MKKITQRKLSGVRSRGGYVALSLVSIVSLIMLIISVSVGSRVVDTAADVGDYESFRATRAVALACVSIVREKVVEGSLESVNDALWQLGYEKGVCQVAISETFSGLSVRIVGFVAGIPSMSVGLSATIEMNTGRLLALTFL